MGFHYETTSRITRLVELEDELVDELVLQLKQLLGLRRFPRKTTRTWRLMLIFIRAHYIREVKVVKKKILCKFFMLDDKEGGFHSEVLEKFPPAGCWFFLVRLNANTSWAPVSAAPITTGIGASSTLSSQVHLEVATIQSCHSVRKITQNLFLDNPCLMHIMPAYKIENGPPSAGSLSGEAS